eukprot:g1021.t1
MAEAERSESKLSDEGRELFAGAHEGGQWSCSACTLLNEPTAVACAVCGTARLGLRNPSHDDEDDEDEYEELQHSRDAFLQAANAKVTRVNPSGSRSSGKKNSGWRGTGSGSDNTNGQAEGMRGDAAASPRGNAEGDHGKLVRAAAEVAMQGGDVFELKFESGPDPDGRGGTRTLRARLFVWGARDRVVVSDIDGTLTKSDVMGLTATTLQNDCGSSYTHSGAARFFCKLARMPLDRAAAEAAKAEAGFAAADATSSSGGGSSIGGSSLGGSGSGGQVRVVYVTSRPQALLGYTKQYIEGVFQDGCRLPIGPVITSTGTVSGVLYAEVMGKPKKSVRRMQAAKAADTARLQIPLAQRIAEGTAAARDQQQRHQLSSTDSAKEEAAAKAEANPDRRVDSDETTISGPELCFIINERASVYVYSNWLWHQRQADRTQQLILEHNAAMPIMQDGVDIRRLGEVADKRIWEWERRAQALAAKLKQQKRDKREDALDGYADPRLWEWIAALVRGHVAHPAERYVSGSADGVDVTEVRPNDQPPPPVALKLV